MVIATWPDSGETASQAFRTTLATALSRRLASYHPMVESLVAMRWTSDTPERRSYADHPHGALCCLDDISNRRPKRPAPLGAVQQVGDQFIHPDDGQTDFLVELIPFIFA